MTMRRRIPRHRGWIVLLATLYGLGVLVHAQGDGDGVAPASGGRPHRLLSEYRLFREPGAELEPNTGVLPYDLNTPLFSDYADKFRTVWIPAGTAATWHPDEAFEFPAGTILTKTFLYPRSDGNGRRLLETRLLVREETGWIALPYVWNEEQTDAVLRVAGASRTVTCTIPSGRVVTFEYLIPNRNECAGCHSETGVMAPLGPKARNLNRDYAYADGPMNQLSRWTKAGILRGAPAPERAPRLAAWDDPASGNVEERARAWLEVNCANCHGPKGPAASSGLYLHASVTDRRSLGIRKPPVAAGRGAGTLRYDIVPGRPDESILVFRMENTDDPGIRMPEIGRRLAHEEGIALVRRWIAEMTD